MSPTETRTDYAHPYRPRPLATANRVLGTLAKVKLGTRRLDPAELEAAALRTVGHGARDFGDPSYREPLAVLCNSIEAEARLNPVGRLITRTRLVSTLANRLRVEAALAKDPSITSLPVHRPIVIAGLQRTGTTLLHRLLSADPENRALYSWEALNPAPIRSGVTGRALDLVDRLRGAPLSHGADPRERIAERSERALAYMAPDFFAVHPVEAHAPEEDILLLDLAFRSTVPEATLRVPTFAKWIEEQDQTPAYRYERRVLQLLSHARAPGRGRWVLKTPHHLEWLDVLKVVFPDALIVWTHRDPTTTIASFCSMVAHGRGVFSDDIDPFEIGRDWSRKIARMVSRGLEARAALGDSEFVDVSYKDLLADPIAVAEQIYERAGLTLTAQGETAMREVLATETQHKHGVHRYRLEDFGLEEKTLRATFADYTARYIKK
ncbi:MAG: sulfotransferase [Polyangiaceae bacterium]